MIHFGSFSRIRFAAYGCKHHPTILQSADRPVTDVCEVELRADNSGDNDSYNPDLNLELKWELEPSDVS